MEVVILGAGESGVGAAILAKQKGLSVFVSDKGTIKPDYVAILEKHAIPYESQQHSLDTILRAKLIIKSPGIPDHISLVKTIKDHGIPIVSEIEFAYRYAQGSIIAITGSNGKTTTTKLTHHLLSKAKLPAILGGNIGQSFAAIVALEPKDVIYVLELSSFQLDGIDTFRPHIAALLNVTPDHLDRYDYQLEKYTASKFRIIQNQQEDDHFLYHADNAAMNKFIWGKALPSKLYPVSSQFPSPTEIVMGDHTFLLQNSALRGRHNQMNAAFAIAIALKMEVPPPLIQSGLDDFVNVPHRMESVATIQEVEFINDSKATNVDATYYALEAIHKPIHWIVGGQDKGNDYSSLDFLVSERVKQIICLGVDNQKIVDHFGAMGLSISTTQSVAKAIQLALARALPNEVVLLSPACASFDLFKNYEDRGNQFKEAVAQLKDR